MIKRRMLQNLFVGSLALAADGVFLAIDLVYNDGQPYALLVGGKDA